MAAGKYNIKAEQGVDFTLTMHYEDGNGSAIDLTTYSAKMHVRKSLDDTSTLLKLTSAGTDGEDTDSDGHIQLDGGTDASNTTDNVGKIVITIGDGVMSTVPAGKHVYDLEIIDSSGTKTRLLEGRFEVSREVTR